VQTQVFPYLVNTDYNSTEVGDDLRAVVVGVDQVREDLGLHRERPVVVRARRVEGGDLVGGADDERLARGVAAVVVGSAATGAAGEEKGRGSEGPDGEAETAARAVVQ
jgi:hypothetical protein